MKHFAHRLDLETSNYRLLPALKTNDMNLRIINSCVIQERRTTWQIWRQWYKQPNRCNNNGLFIIPISSTFSGDNFAHSQEHSTVFTACGIMHRRCCRPVASSVHYTTSCKHSLVLLRMGEIIARNMLSWLELWINRYCCIYLVVCIIVSVMHGHTNIKLRQCLNVIKWLNWTTISGNTSATFGFNCTVRALNCNGNEGSKLLLWVTYCPCTKLHCVISQKKNVQEQESQ